MAGTSRRPRAAVLGAFAAIVLAGCGGIPKAPEVQPLTEGVLDSLPTITFEAPAEAPPSLPAASTGSR